MSLLNRIGAVRDGDRARAIARNVEAILNSKRGYGGTLAHFGLTDLEIEDEAAVHLEELADDMQAQIVLFEPRLSAVQVSVLGPGEGQWLRLLVAGVDHGHLRRLLVRYDRLLRCCEVSVFAEVDR